MNINLLQDGELLNADNLNRAVVELSEHLQTELIPLPGIISKLSTIEDDAQKNLEVVNNLTSDTLNPLSALQGKILKGFIDNINDILNSDDTTLDELQEIVDFIKLNRAELESLSIDNIAGLQNALDNKQPINSVLTNTTASFTTALLSKLNSIQSQATKNRADSLNADKTHTHDDLYYTKSQIDDMLQQLTLIGSGTVGGN